MSDFKVSVKPLRAIHRRNRLIESWHKLLEISLVVCISFVAGLELRSVGVLIHSIPVYTVCSCHNRMRSIRFIIVGTVVPHSIVAIVTRFDNTVSNGSEGCTIHCIRECGSNLCSFCRAMLSFCLFDYILINAAVVLALRIYKGCLPVFRKNRLNKVKIQ